MAVVEMWLQAILLCVMITQAIKLVYMIPTDLGKRALTSLDLSWRWDGKLDDSESGEMERRARCICAAPAPQLRHIMRSVPDAYSPMCQVEDPLHNLMAGAAMMCRITCEAVSDIIVHWQAYAFPLLVVMTAALVVKNRFRRSLLAMQLMQQSKMLGLEIVTHLLASAAMAASYCSSYNLLAMKGDGSVQNAMNVEATGPKIIPLVPVFDTITKNLSPFMVNASYQVVLWLIFTSLVGPWDRYKRTVVGLSFLMPALMYPLVLSQSTLMSTPWLAMGIPFTWLLWRLLLRRICRVFIYLSLVAKNLQQRQVGLLHVLALGWLLGMEWWINALVLPLLVFLPALLFIGEYLLSPWVDMTTRIVWGWKMALAVNQTYSESAEVMQWTIIDAATDNYSSLWGTASFLAAAVYTVFSLIEMVLPSGRASSMGHATAIQLVASAVSSNMMNMSPQQKQFLSQQLFRNSLELLVRETEWRSDLAVLWRPETKCPKWVSTSCLALSYGSHALLLYVGGASEPSMLRKLSWLGFGFAIFSETWAATRTSNLLLMKVLLKGSMAIGRLIAWSFFVVPWADSSVQVFSTGLLLCLDIDAATTAIKLKNRNEVRQSVHNMYPSATAEQLANHNDVCPVCREEMLEAKMTPCHHFFHEECLQSAMMVQRVCPVCRQALQAPRTILDEAARLITMVGGEWTTNGIHFFHGVLAPIWPMSMWTLLFLRNMGHCREFSDPHDPHLLHEINDLVNKRLDLLAEVTFPNENDDDDPQDEEEDSDGTLENQDLDI